MTWRPKLLGKVHRDMKAGKVETSSAENVDVPAATDLSDAQLAIVKAQAELGFDDNTKAASLFAPYRFASKMELLLVAVSVACSVASGVPVPLMIVIFGQLVGNVSSQASASTGDSSKDLLGGADRIQLVLYLIYIAIGSFVLETIATAGWQHSGRRLARKVREEYFRTLLRQNVGFYDTFGTGKVASYITSEMNQIQDAISEKLGLTIKTVAMLIAAFIVGFVQYWALALILTSSLLAIALVMGIIAIPMKKWTQESSEHAAQASMVAEETFTASKTVLALNMKHSMMARFRKPAHAAENSSWGAKAMMAMMMAVMM